MEDVWKDISLASLCHDHHVPGSDSSRSTAITHPPAAFRGMIFQDLLATTTTTTSNKDNDPPPQPTIAPVRPASTVLSLNSGARYLQHQLIESTTNASPSAPPMKPNPQIQLQISDHHATSFLKASSCSDALDSSLGFPRPSHKKRARALDHDQNDVYNSSGDRRHKRMMKNRESASRSRAGKQETFCLISCDLVHPFY